MCIRYNLGQIDNQGPNANRESQSTVYEEVLGVRKTAPSRLAYLLMRENFFIEDIRLQFLLPNIQTYDSALKELHAKRNEIWDEFYIWAP